MFALSSYNSNKNISVTPDAPAAPPEVSNDAAAAPQIPAPPVVAAPDAYAAFEAGHAPEASSAEVIPETLAAQVPDAYAAFEASHAPALPAEAEAASAPPAPDPYTAFEAIHMPAAPVIAVVSDATAPVSRDIIVLNGRNKPAASEFAPVTDSAVPAEVETAAVPQADTIYIEHDAPAVSENPAAAEEHVAAEPAAESYIPAVGQEYVAAEAAPAEVPPGSESHAYVAGPEHVAEETEIVPAAPEVPAVAESYIPAPQEHIVAEVAAEPVASEIPAIAESYMPVPEEHMAVESAPPAAYDAPVVIEVQPAPEAVAFNDNIAEVSEPQIMSAGHASAEPMVQAAYEENLSPPAETPASFTPDLTETAVSMEGSVMQVANDIPAASERNMPVISSDMVAADPLSAIEAEHRRWLMSEGREGKRASLRGMDFSHADLSGRCFMEASLRGAILTGANLSGADLRAADFAEANLDDANLSGAKLSGATFARAQLHRTSATGADLATANFTAAIAENIDLTNAKLDGAILRDANFRQARFLGASLRNANARGATIVGADLSGVDLSSADCRDVNFDRACFKGAILSGANFRGAKLGDVDLQLADFSQALDVAAEVIVARSEQAEHGKLQEEQAKLKEEQQRIEAARTELEKREKAFAEEKGTLEPETNRIAGLQVLHAEFSEELASFSRGFVLSAVLWVVFASVIIGLTAYAASQLQHIKTERAVFIVGMALFAASLAVFCMLRSLKLYGMVKELAAISPSRSVQAESGGQGATTPAAPKKRFSAAHKYGLGFGKKK